MPSSLAALSKLISEGPASFLPHGPRRVELTFHPTPHKLGSDMHWIVRNDPGAMTHAGFPELESKHVGSQLRLKFFHGPDELARWLADHRALQGVLRMLDGVVRVPEHVLPGTLTVTDPSDGHRETLCAALVPLTFGEHVGRLRRYPAQTLESPIREIVLSLRKFRVAMRMARLAFRDLRPEHLFLPYDLSTRQGEEDYGAFSKCVMLMEWEGMSRGDRSGEPDEAWFLRDFNAMEDITTIMVRSVPVANTDNVKR
ncbi:hypothetical protein FA95DRAFT_1567749 [Auriscalpium vulgare]|uniref:Uncharacterized protein n=1 Tax=Auriscalpium vulgare TaxID=40419 RepID=A0ACB8R324_9AGAM|nr:hypothetical protein FA95DRAFT_1567749 [Auriscalpium vulgare]